MAVADAEVADVNVDDVELVEDLEVLLGEFGQGLVGQALQDDLVLAVHQGHQVEGVVVHPLDLLQLDESVKGLMALNHFVQLHYVLADLVDRLIQLAYVLVLLAFVDRVDALFRLRRLLLLLSFQLGHPCLQRLQAFWEEEVTLGGALLAFQEEPKGVALLGRVGRVHLFDLSAQDPFSVGQVVTIQQVLVAYQPFLHLFVFTRRLLYALHLAHQGNGAALVSVSFLLPPVLIALPLSLLLPLELSYFVLELRLLLTELIGQALDALLTLLLDLLYFLIQFLLLALLGEKAVLFHFSGRLFKGSDFLLAFLNLGLQLCVLLHLFVQVRLVLSGQEAIAILFHLQGFFQLGQVVLHFTYLLYQRLLFSFKVLLQLQPSMSFYPLLFPRLGQFPLRFLQKCAILFVLLLQHDVLVMLF